MPHPILSDYWYYAIEHAPGEITPGHRFPSIANVRQLLADVDVRDQRCLDVCCMDGLVPALLLRRSPALVHAWDRIDQAAKFAFLGLSVAQFRQGRNLVDMAAGYLPHDVVIFSGVLYHVFDPLAALLACRSVVRNGGIWIVETAASLHPGPTLEFNAAGHLPGLENPAHANYWVPTIDLLGYLLRLCHARPLAVRWYATHADQIRIAVVCRAESGVVGGDADPWLAAQDSALPNVRMNFGDYVDWSATATVDVPPVPWHGEGDPDDRRGLSVLRARTPETPAATRERLSVLYLSDAV